MAKKVEKPKREVTKRQLSHWQQQRKRQRFIIIVGISIVAAVLLLIGVGWYVNQYQPLHQIVARVSDTEFNMDYYIKMLKFYGEGWPAEYMDFLADEVITIIEQGELVRRGALEAVVTVSDEEIKEQLKSYDPPLSRDYRDVAMNELLVNKMLDSYFEKRVPVYAEQVNLMAMFLESESQVDEIRARIEAGEDFAALAEEFSLDSSSKDKQGDLGWHPEDMLAELLGTSTPGEYAFGVDIEGGVLSLPLYDETKTKSLGYWLVKIVERQSELEQINVQAILLGSEEEALEVRARLEDGEDFTTLAEELSQHAATSGSGGDFGWLLAEDVASDSNLVAWGDIFELETGVISQPIRDDTQETRGGYWLLEVLAKEDNRQISDEDRDWLKYQALDEWLLSLWDDYKYEIQSYLTDEMKAWAIERVTGG